MKIDIKKLQERIDEIQQMIKDASESNREDQTSFPQGGDTFYWITATGKTVSEVWSDSLQQREMLDFGNVFQTATEAEEHAKRWKELRLITERMLVT